jgi:hypothetical protein
LKINERLKKIRPIKLKSKIQRAQSVPVISFSPETYLTNFGLYEEDPYLESPPIDLINNSNHNNYSDLVTPSSPSNLNFSFFKNEINSNQIEKTMPEVI